MGCNSSQPSAYPGDFELQARPAPQSQGSQKFVASVPSKRAQKSSGRTRTWTPPGQSASLVGYRPDPRHRVPRPQRDPNGEEIEQAQPFLDRGALLNALSITAKRLKSKGLHYTIVTLGGSLNTIYLRTRSLTQDIDFFTADYEINDVENIAEAADYTYRHIGPDLIGNEWLNNRVVAFIPLALARVLVRRALAQNVAIFKNPGLTVLAAPWSYSFTAKAERLLQENVKSFDAVDAVHYLRQYILTHGKRLVTFNLIRQWASEYDRVASDFVIKQINTMYRDFYHEDAVEELVGTHNYRPYTGMNAGLFGQL